MIWSIREARAVVEGEGRRRVRLCLRFAVVNLVGSVGVEVAWLGCGEMGVESRPVLGGESWARTWLSG
jgi:hypothetical protein